MRPKTYLRLKAVLICIFALGLCNSYLRKFQRITAKIYCTPDGEFICFADVESNGQKCDESKTVGGKFMLLTKEGEIRYISVVGYYLTGAELCEDYDQIELIYRGVEVTIDSGKYLFIGIENKEETQRGKYSYFMNRAHDNYCKDYELMNASTRNSILFD